MTRITDMVVGWKKLLFLLILSYTAFMVMIYHGHFSFQRLLSPFSHTTVASTEDMVQSSLRYLMHVSNETNGTSSILFDIHLEHPILGHAGDVIEVNEKEHLKSHLTTIAIGGGLTSRKISGLTEANIPHKFLVFTTLLPSFCKTASKNYQYHFYFAYDTNDKFFSNPKMVAAFQKHFSAVASKQCKHLSAPLHLHFVQCSHTGKPAWAQNDAMMEAYLDGVDFFYRVNDDSEIQSAAWTEAFIRTLTSYEPKYVGVVGPKHSGGNTVILTYDFVHRTHIDIFGFYYPRFFSTWWADDWVTKVYQPGRSTKLSNILLKHTMRLGQRYQVDYSVSKKVTQYIGEDKKILQRYLKAKMMKNPPEADGTKIISFSLYGKDPKSTMGAIRNAQLMPVYYPGWTMRVYLLSPNSTGNADVLVPRRIVNCLKGLGVDLAYISGEMSEISPDHWKYLIADDIQAEVFLIRDVRMRISDREAEAVKDWLQSGSSFHCMRDHPSHRDHVIVDGLWGARVPGFRSLLDQTIGSLLRKETGDILRDVIEPVVKDVMYCHDSVPCSPLANGHPFPMKRIGQEYVGNQFNECQEVIDHKLMMQVNTMTGCPPQLPKKSAIGGTPGKQIATTRQQAPIKN
ncbi:hypothetical protein LSH36_5g04040 [Paralvinella palmiformis]|uniref:Uncharacterized protein n=1 Tax=Paralvinella palmiformis TaxID=53620 RepID=A0AAD9NH84_9ANNE|nr:hypothetical protein LSH36_5g04040 [Paralvinella palmiformis]